VILLLVIHSCTASQESKKNEFKVDSVYSYHLGFVKDRIEDSMLNYSQINIVDHIIFLESLTGIESRANYSDAGILYPGISAELHLPI